MSTSNFFRRQEEDKIDPLALRPREAAATLGISASTLDRLTRAGKIPHVKINRLVLYRVEALKEWLKAREQAGDDVAGS